MERWNGTKEIRRKHVLPPEGQEMLAIEFVLQSAARANNSPDFDGHFFHKDEEGKSFVYACYADGPCGVWGLGNVTPASDWEDWELWN